MFYPERLTPEEREWVNYTTAAAVIGAMATGAVNLVVNEIQGALQRRRERMKAETVPDERR